jgi:hypothetical protein
VATPGAPALPALLVQSANMVYQGAFRVPLPDWGRETFAFGGTALTFNPVRGTLLLVGHDHHQEVAEISIPAARKSETLDGFASSTMVQPFAEATEGRLGAVNPSDPNSKKVGGLLVYKDKLYQTVYSYYDGSGTQKLSHFVGDLDLSVKGEVQGPFAVGTLGAGYVSGYFAMIPESWQPLLGGPVLNGNCCLGVISRTSYGPSVSVIDPATIGGAKPAPAVPLVYYTATRTTLGTWEGTNPYFNGSTEVRGVVFPGGTKSVLFFGRHGTGTFCYGSGPECGDPAEDSKGVHAYPYLSYVWAYDATDLAAVKAGNKKPWDVKPYAVWELKLPFSPPNRRLNGAAYDPATGRIFVLQSFGDGTKPLIHVFTIQP